MFYQFLILKIGCSAPISMPNLHIEIGNQVRDMDMPIDRVARIFFACTFDRGPRCAFREFQLLSFAKFILFLGFFRVYHSYLLSWEVEFWYVLVLYVLEGGGMGCSIILTNIYLYSD